MSSSGGPVRVANVMRALPYCRCIGTGRYVGGRHPRLALPAHRVAVHRRGRPNSDHVGDAHFACAVGEHRCLNYAGAAEGNRQTMLERVVSISDTVQQVI